MKTVVIWLAMVFVLSVYPFNSGVSFPYADKIVHFIIYAVTCALFFSVLRLRDAKKRLMVSFALSSAYGILMETAQVFIQTRGFSLLDVFANMLGAASAAVFILIIRRKA
jgi:VanZ family protein